MVVLPQLKLEEKYMVGMNQVAHALGVAKRKSLREMYRPYTKGGDSLSDEGFSFLIHLSVRELGQSLRDTHETPEALKRLLYDDEMRARYDALRNTPRRPGFRFFTGFVVLTRFSPPIQEGVLIGQTNNDFYFVVASWDLNGKDMMRVEDL